MPDKDSVEGHDDQSPIGELEKPLPVTSDEAVQKLNRDDAGLSPTAALAVLAEAIVAADFISPATISIAAKGLTAEDFIYPLPAPSPDERTGLTAPRPQVSDQRHSSEPIPVRTPLLESMGLIVDLAVAAPLPALPADEIIEVASSPCFLNEVALSQPLAQALPVPVDTEPVITVLPIEQSAPEPPAPPAVAFPVSPLPEPPVRAKPFSFQDRPEPRAKTPEPERQLAEVRPEATEAPRPAPMPPARSPWSHLRTAGTWLLRGFAAYAAIMVCLIVLFRFVDPPGSALMAWRWISGTDIQTSWVPIGTMSPYLVQAVVVSEDGTFCTHNGIDIGAMQDAIEKSTDGIPRGASTISMQVTKNMFLWPSKSYVRKAIEIPLTLVMELVWPKQRILEVYLNIAEWGPGIFGAEAAAQHHFQKPASSLTPREAAQLAASLPNPFRRDAGDPGPRTARKANTIQARMRAEGGVASCVFSPREAVATKAR